MGIMTRISERFTPREDPQVEFLKEAVSDLARQLERDEQGWSPLTGSDDEMTREALTSAARQSRAMAVAHPLVRRALKLRQAYVHGMGMTITAATKDEGGQDVDSVIREFWDDEGNRAAFTGSQARDRLEQTLGTDGNIFITCFTNPLTGAVQPRTIPFDEIAEVITDPDDRTRPWFYKRVWTRTGVEADGVTTVTKAQERTDFYPALSHFPTRRPKLIDGHEVHWGSPVYHAKVNDLDGWTLGIGDVYSALAWARAYRDGLADWATLVKSLSQFAWRATSKGSKTQQMRQALSRSPQGSPDGNPNGVGATAVTSPDVTLEAIPKTGATIDSESFRPLAAMVAAGLDIPLTILLADPGVTGARATAETLDEPLRLAMESRRSLWREIDKAIGGYVIRQAVKAPRGPLSGTVIRDKWSGREVVTLAGDTSALISIEYPSLEKLPLETLMSAIAAADSTGKVPPVEILRWILSAMRAEDADDIIEAATDENGDWVDPAMSAGQAAVDAFRRGQDPASQQNGTQAAIQAIQAAAEEE